MGKHLQASTRLSDHLVLLGGVADRPSRHGLARRVLAGVLGCDEGRVEIWHDPSGKPHLAGGALCLSLSHRDGLLLVGTAVEPIGVDIEFVQNGRDIARFLFSRDEARWLDTAPQPDQAFTQLWTAKEAVLKAAGQGIALGLAQPDFAPVLGLGQPFDADVCDISHQGILYHLQWHRIEERGRQAIACSAVRRHALDTFHPIPLPAPAPRPLTAPAG